MKFNSKQIVAANGGGVITSQTYKGGYSVTGEFKCENPQDIFHVVLHTDANRSAQARGQIKSGLVIQFHSDANLLQAKYYGPDVGSINGKQIAARTNNYQVIPDEWTKYKVVCNGLHVDVYFGDDWNYPALSVRLPDRSKMTGDRVGFLSRYPYSGQQTSVIMRNTRVTSH